MKIHFLKVKMQACRALLSIVFIECVTHFVVFGQNVQTNADGANKHLTEMGDWIIDKFLSVSREKGDPFLSFGSFKNTLTSEHWYLPGTLTLYGRNGLMSGFSALYRQHNTTQVTRIEDGNNVFHIIKTQLFSQDLHFFIELGMKYFMLDTDGKVDAKVMNNSISVEVLVTLQPHCSLRLYKLQLESMKNVHMTFTGYSFYTPFVYATSFCADEIIGVFKHKVEVALFNFLSKAVTDSHICNDILLDNTKRFGHA